MGSIPLKNGCVMRSAVHAPVHGRYPLLGLSLADTAAWTARAFGLKLTDSACFLTRVTGHFEGGGEVVPAFTSGGSWYLGGQSHQQEVAAGAQCVGIAPSFEYSWDQGQPSVFVAPATSNVACFLTRMKGGFEGYNEMVDISNYSCPWYLGGYSAHSGVGASARCL
jgi:hypothetical protein